MIGKGMRQIIINGRPVKLRQSQLIQSGGEGMVFELANGAVKLYHLPGPECGSELTDWISGPPRAHVPKNVLGPEALVTDLGGRIVGFQMTRLAYGMTPLKRLANPLFWKTHDATSADVIPIFTEMRSTLSSLHMQGIVVGDLNDNNIFFHMPLTGSKRHGPLTQWIDVDSYQFKHHLCRVALDSFLDPLLYGVGQLSQGQFFSPSTDWYAFLTLLVKSLLQVHPYGGVHRTYKTLRSRAVERISILSPKVTYPKAARPPEVLSDALLHQMHLVFDQGKRPPFPQQILRDFAGSLIDCPACGLSYPSNRAGCPACRHLTVVPQVTHLVNEMQIRTLMEVDGFIEHVHGQRDGRIMVVKRAGSNYSLVRAGVGGVLGEEKLFQGRPGYSFGLFGSQMVVNPPNDNKLIILDRGSGSPRKVALIETATFTDRAVFGSTNRALYRIAGSWIMRGILHRGHFVEEPVDMAHRAQTCFWASPYDDVIAGYHRVFGDLTYFIVHGSGRRHAFIPAPPGTDEHIADTRIVFGPGTLALVQLVGRSGSFHKRTSVWGTDGRWLFETRQEICPTGEDDLQSESFPFTRDASLPAPPFQLIPAALVDSGSPMLLLHPGGILIRESRKLKLATKIK